MKYQNEGGPNLVQSFDLVRRTTRPSAPQVVRFFDYVIRKMAMKIGSKYIFSEVQARHWEQLAAAVGLSKAQARKRILALAKSLPRDSA
jgi:serine/threonine-protein kinase HipA